MKIYYSYKVRDGLVSNSYHSIPFIDKESYKKSVAQAMKGLMHFSNRPGFRATIEGR